MAISKQTSVFVAMVAVLAVLAANVHEATAIPAFKDYLQKRFTMQQNVSGTDRLKECYEQYGQTHESMESQEFNDCIEFAKYVISMEEAMAAVNKRNPYLLYHKAKQA